MKEIFDVPAKKIGEMSDNINAKETAMAHVPQPTAILKVQQNVTKSAHRLAGAIASEPQDLEQDFWLRLLRRWKQYDPTRSSPQTYAYQLMRSMFLDRYDRHRNVRKQMRTVQLQPEHFVNLPGRSSGNPDLAADIQTCIWHLPPQQRALVTLLREHTVRETATIMGISENRCYHLLYKVRKTFARLGMASYLRGV